MEWSKLSNEKELFIRDMILSNTISAAFQRVKGGIYIGEATAEQKEGLRKKIGKYLVEIEKECYPAGDKDPHERIKNFIKNTAGPVLKNGKLSFGVAQKLVNLYLKYLWCLEKSDTPPHCPIDSNVLRKIKWDKPSWTNSEFMEKEYKIVIKKCEDIAKQDLFENLSEWELVEFNRLRDRDFSIENIKKCLCTIPLCAKCLSVNCEDNDCKIHTKIAKENWRRNHLEDKSVENSGRNNLEKDLEINVSMGSKNSRKIKV